MPPFLTLLLLSLLMGVASYLSGLAPLSFNLSQHRIRLISSFGIGILVGTALIVIIPEGVETLYSVGKPEDQETYRRGIGLSLIIGFVMMYLVDKLPDYIAKRNMSGFVSIPIDMSNLRFTSAGGSSAREHQDTESAAAEPGSNNGEGNNHSSAHTGQSKSVSTSIGLIIHSVSDGVALGASVSSHNTALETIVFLAIMVHKAPASFGFSAVLLREGLSLSNVKKNLAMFAAAAPLGAILTYLIIKFLGASDQEMIQKWTGLLLLFSGGTFLFVSMHAMQELDETVENSAAAVDSNSSDSPAGSGIDLALTFGGMLFPLLTLLVPDV